MKLGLCTSVNNIEVALEIGFDYVVLSGTEVTSLEEKEYRKLEELVIMRELPILAFNGLCPPSIDIAGPKFSENASRKYIEKLVKRGAGIGIKNIGIGAPKSRRIPAGYSHKEAWNQIRSFCIFLSEECQKYGVKASIEELTYKYCNCVNTLEESRLMMDAVNMENFGLIIDFFHTEADGYPSDAAGDYIQYAYDIHISGIDSEAVPGRPFVGMKDRNRLEAIANVLEKHGYDRTVTLEPDSVTEGEFCQKAEEALRIMQKTFNHK